MALDRPRPDPSLGAALGLFVVAAGLTIGMRSLSDNSFLTHLATGRLILAEGSVPSSDPYTFTAAGEDWVVQSWLASVLYAMAEGMGGMEGVRLFVGSLAGVLALLGWRLLRPADGVVARLALGALFVAVAAGLWSERPLMLGLIALALTMIAAEGALDPRWLVPIGWVWVNSHGSFPLALVFLAVAALGTRLDGGDWGHELRCLGWSAAGILVGMIGPLGPRALLFPVGLLQRQDVLSNVVEWRSPTFDDLSQRSFVVQLVVAVVLLARRPSYRSALLVAVFGAAALLGARNLTVASLVLLPVMARGAAGIGNMSSTEKSRIARLVGATGVALAALLVIARLQQPVLNLDKYPVDAVAYMDEVGIDMRENHLAAPDFAGNFLAYVYGADGRVFYDDRFDMFPDAVTEAHLALVRVDPDLRTELERYDIEVVLTPRTAPATSTLTAGPAWRTLYTDEGWTLTCLRGSDLGGSVGRC